MAPEITHEAIGTAGIGAAQKKAQALIARVLHKSRRKRRTEAFIKAIHDDALAFARAFFETEEDAEEALSDAYARLARGDSDPKHFFRLIKQSALNKIAKAKFDARVAAMPMPQDSVPIDARDPLEVLIEKSELDEAIFEVQNDRRRRGILNRDWWKELAKFRGLSRNCPRRLHY